MKATGRSWRMLPNFHEVFKTTCDSMKRIVFRRRISEGESEMQEDNVDNLQCFDELIVFVRPLEDLFLLMGTVDKEQAGLVSSCSEIGLVLTARLRKQLEQMFRIAPKH